MTNPTRPGRPTLRLETLEDRRTPAVNVAVVGSPSGGGADSGFAAIVAQLNDDTYFDFSASLVAAAQVDTVGELNAYDVVVIGATGYPNGDPFDNAAFTAALRTWVEAGNGVVLSGPGVFAAGPGSGPPIADIDAIIPVDTTGASLPNRAGTVAVNGTAHAVTAGVADFTLNSQDFVEVAGGGNDPGTILLGTTNGGRRSSSGPPGRAAASSWGRCIRAPWAPSRPGTTTASCGSAAPTG